MVLDYPFVWTARRNLLNQSGKNTRRYLRSVYWHGLTDLQGQGKP